MLTLNIPIFVKTRTFAVIYKTFRIFLARAMFPAGHTELADRADADYFEVAGVHGSKVVVQQSSKFAKALPGCGVCAGLAAGFSSFGCSASDCFLPPTKSNDTIVPTNFDPVPFFPSYVSICRSFIR